MLPSAYTVGLGETGRVASKVLKPPGGGMSEVFAGDSSPEPEEHITPTRPYRMASNFELSDEQPDIITPPRKSSKPSINPVTGEIMVFPGGIGSSNSSSMNSSPISSPNNGKMSLDTSPMSTPPIKSKRVPPGGYSSPLW